MLCLKKKMNASTPSEHPPVRGKNVKTFSCYIRYIHGEFFSTTSSNTAINSTRRVKAKDKERRHRI